MSTGFKLLCEATLFRGGRQMVVDRGAISTEDVVIASFLEGWLRRKGEARWQLEGNKRLWESWFRMGTAQEGS